MGLFGRKDPAAATGARGATIAADVIEKIYGHRVTYVPDDLVFVDQATSDLAASGSLETKWDTLGTFGCLLGEILVRADGAKWISVDPSRQPELGTAIALELPSGLIANPIGAVYRNAQDPANRSAVAFREQSLLLPGPRG